MNGILLSEVRQTQIPYDLTSMWNLIGTKMSYRADPCLPERSGMSRMGTIFQLLKSVSPGEAMSSTVTTLNNTVLHICKLLRERADVLIIKKNFHNCDNRC